MVTRICLDMDGVCTRLIMHALEIATAGIVSRYDDERYPLPGVYATELAANQLLKESGRTVSRAELWASVPRYVWATTPPTAEYAALFRECERIVGRAHLFFATRQTEYPDSAAGKLEWVSTYAPAYMATQTIIGAPKDFGANARTLLIDDCDDNVLAFREAGGAALLMPRPWNSRHDEKPEVIFNELALACKQPERFAGLRALQERGLVPR